MKKARKTRKTTQWATVAELRREWIDAIGEDRSESAVYTHLRQGRVKQNRDGRYNRAEFFRIVLRARSRESTAGSAAKQSADPGRLKKALECQILKHKLDTLQGLFISVEQHRATLTEVFQIVRDVYAQDVSELKVLTGNAALVERWKKRRDAAYETMCRRAEDVA